MKGLLLILSFAVLVQSSSINRVKRDQSAEDVAKDIENQVTDVLDQIMGGTCLTNDQCMEFISYCHRESSLALTGTCALNWWSWLIVAVVAALFIGCCVACICCQCCCLYACCSAILDCLCCCCRNKGYSPANRG